MLSRITDLPLRPLPHRDRADKANFSMSDRKLALRFFQQHLLNSDRERFLIFCHRNIE